MRETRWKRVPLATSAATGRVKYLLQVEVLTPMFGGGVEIDGSRKPCDPITLIRGASIRGQLRFWWRAVNPRGCTAVKELRVAEAEVFGTAASGKAKQAGVATRALSVCVPQQPARAEDVQVFEEGSKRIKRGLEGVAYGAFPLRDTESANVHGVLHQIRDPFSLELDFPASSQRDIDAALWAWLNFGGLGGRTRRGFGAVALKRSNSDTARFPLGVADGWKEFVRNDGAPAAWPRLPHVAQAAFREVHGREETPVSALNVLLRKLQTLRQGVRVGRAKGETKAQGRSYWPEPDSIRALVGTSLPRHRDPVTGTKLFPRAAFGTPIIFHFLDANEGGARRNRNLEPPDTTLNPVDKGRFASSLILRVARGPDQRMPFMLRALRLEHPAPEGGYELTASDRDIYPVETRIQSAEHARWGLDGRPSPLVKGDFVTTDPIERFFKEFE